uniref:Immunoglobulin subtype domain-containing protein n=1 Tax=Poecilia formosa TaxID=48698 RepID=A0A096M1G6_POEFO
ITVTCEFGYTGKTRFFCKETCKGKNILIQTTEDRDEKGRFSIRYEERSHTEFDFLHVSITDLKPSDSGRYRCRSDGTVLLNLFGNQHADFDLVVTEASDFSKPKWTPRPLIRSTFVPAASPPPPPFSPSPSETIKSSDKPAAASGSSSLYPLLYVGLSLAVLIIVLVTALLIFCQRKNLHQQKGPPVKKDPTDFT